MPSSYVRLFYHFVWSTWDRWPLLEGEIERHAYALVCQQCTRLKCVVHRIGGISDHVHLLVSLPITLPVSEFMNQVKGCSSRAMNETHSSMDWVFKWQGGYGVVTVSPRDVPRVIRYIERQKQHHAAGTLWQELEEQQVTDTGDHVGPSSDME